MTTNFNKIKPNIVHLDINSCFATVEQQANPLLRGKPVAVAAYNSPSGCILAASIEAKKLGIRTGMKVYDGKLIYPKLIVLTPDPPKYRKVHKMLYNLLCEYSEKVIPKSIDEFVFALPLKVEPLKVCGEIKKRIKQEIGEYITVSIGISTNSYLAKIASNFQKPDGLVEINKKNRLKIFAKLKLTDLTGIKQANEARLRIVGIKTVLDFYNSPIWRLRLAFGGIVGYYWHLNLHGLEVNTFESKRSTFGNSYAPPFNKAHLKLEILSKLCQKTGSRLRNAGFVANGIHLSISYRDGSYWHKSAKTKRAIFESGDIYKEAVNLLNKSMSSSLPRVLAVNVFNLTSSDNLQLDIFGYEIKKSHLVGVMDLINKKWGLYTIYPARMTNDPTVVQDRISFGQS